MTTKRKHTGIQKVIDQLSRDSSGKRRSGVGEVGDIFDDIRRELHKRYGIDLYDMFRANAKGMSMLITDSNDETWWAFREHAILSRKKRQ